MAFDEILGPQLAYLDAFIASSLKYWADAANKARTSAYTIDDFFDDLRAQFVRAWDGWNYMMAQPAEDILPTVVVRGPWNQLAPPSPAYGSARVGARLTNAVYVGTDLERFGGGATIPKGGYVISDDGTFEGYVMVTMAANAPVAPAGPGPDVYRGVILADLGPVSSSSTPAYKPLAWLIVEAQ